MDVDLGELTEVSLSLWSWTADSVYRETSEETVEEGLEETGAAEVDDGNEEEFRLASRSLAATAEGELYLNVEEAADALEASGENLAGCEEDAAVG